MRRAHPARAEPDRVPERLPDQGDGRAGRGLRRGDGERWRAQFDPAFDAATVERRPSKAGNYLGLTITVTATSREQLDELYRTLSTHPMVKVVL